MTKRISVLFSVLLATFALSAQDADRITGTYLSHDKDLRIDICRDDNLYQGIAAWSSVSPDYVGIAVFRNLRYDADKREYIGKIFDPRFDKEYNVRITVEDDGNLRVCPWWGPVKMKFIWTKAPTSTR